MRVGLRFMLHPYPSSFILPVAWVARGYLPVTTSGREVKARRDTSVVLCREKRQSGRLRMEAGVSRQFGDDGVGDGEALFGEGEAGGGKE